jgi:hypothetical protein
MEHIIGYTKEESKNLECILNFSVTDSEHGLPAEWDVILFKDSLPRYSKYGVCFTRMIDGIVSDNKYWQFTYGADTLLGEEYGWRNKRDVGICLHGGGTYEDSVNMNAPAYHEALDKVAKHLIKIAGE